MFEVIRDWFATDIITVLNTTVATALSETDRDLDTELLPANQKDYHYTLQIGDVEELNLEAEQYRVSCVCKLSFIANTKDVSNYEAYLDDYVFPIVRLLKRYSTGIDTSGISFNEVELGSIKANLNVFEDNYFKPQIEFTVKVIDSVDMSLAVPSAPTLTSPSNGSTSGLTDQSFNWTGTADTWNFVLLNGTTEVINQDGLTVSSFTIPADSLLTDGTTYTWKVRGKNEAGYGSFSSLYSFTVNDSSVVAMTPLEVGLTDIWVRGDDITLSGSNVSSWNDKSGNGRHLTNATTGNRPITETINGKTFVKFEGTITNVRNLSFNDISHVFKVTGTQTRTFAFSIVTRQNTPGRFNSVFARSNNNVGDEYQLRLPTNFGASPYFYFYTFLTNDQTTTGCLILPENEGVLRQVIIEVNLTTAKLYIDGVLASVVTLKFPAIDLPATAATFLVIGGTRQPNASQGTFAGAIGEFSSGSVALTTSQVASLYKYHQEYYGTG